MLLLLALLLLLLLTPEADGAGVPLRGSVAKFFLGGGGGGDEAALAKLSERRHALRRWIGVGSGLDTRNGFGDSATPGSWARLLTDGLRNRVAGEISSDSSSRVVSSSVTLPDAGVVLPGSIRRRVN